MAKDYKDTLNLPRTEFPMKANLTRREPELIRLWQERDIYFRVLQRRDRRRSFILHDGPPYANGHIHMGHALNKVLKDFIVKYKAMRGYYAPYVPGWDCHGLPIELQVDKKLGSKKAATSVLDKRRLCREYADRFVGIQRDEFIRLGVLGDWFKPYLTMSYEYEATIIREFYRLLETGYVYRGKKPVHWCPSCATALAEAEVEYSEKTSPSIFVRFRIVDDKGIGLSEKETFFIIWTTTPWTLPANLALAVHPEVEYSLIKTDDVQYIVATELVERLRESIGLEGEEIRRFIGKELEGIRARHPFIERDSLVITGDFVTTTEGTGIVHIAPGHGEDDYIAGLRYNLEIYAPVDDRGCFTIDDIGLKGEFVFKANDRIMDVLREKSALMAQEEIRHSYPHCWRCKRPVIFRATEQWFISVEHNELRKHCLEEIENVSWIPPWGKERIRSMMERRPDWCISRQRAWGVPIAVLTCKRCSELVKDRIVLERVVSEFEKGGADVWFEREPGYFLPDGYKCSRCGSEEFKKEMDILDVWFDSGVSHAAVLEKDERLSWPSDMYLEGSDQHRGWFQSSLITAAATRGAAPYRMVLTHGFVVDGTGKKMSKSLGNVISPDEIIKNNGAEILRLWVSAEDYRDDVRLSREILSRLIEAYRKIRNTARFLLGNLYDYDLKDYSSCLLEIDRYILSRLQNLIKKVTLAYERFDFHEVFHSVYNFCIVELSAFYLDILKDRLYTFRADSPERRAAQWTMYQILYNITLLVAPVLSFTAEEIWRYIPGKKEESVFLHDFPQAREELIEPDLEERWKRLIALRDMVNKALEIKRNERLIGNSLEAKVTLYVDDGYRELLKAYEEFLPSLFIVSQAEIKSIEEGPSDAYTSQEMTGAAIKVTRASGEKCPRCWNWSEAVKEKGVCQRCHNVLQSINVS